MHSLWRISQVKGLQIPPKLILQREISVPLSNSDHNTIDIKEDKLVLNNISNIDEIENHVTAFSKLIEEATKESVPLKFHNKYSLHLTPEIQRMIKDRNMLRRRWQRYRCPYLKTTINLLSSKI